MMKGLLIFSFCCLSFFVLPAQKNYIQYVNPFIGTGGHGHTYPGAVMPHGMVQVSPDTRLSGWDGCSGYHYSDTFIYGFSHTHLSGTGVSDLGDILLAPMSGVPSPENKIYGSLFSHSAEWASPGYYGVKLKDDDIDVELAATERTAFHQYTFNKAGAQNIILDLVHRDEVIESEVFIEDSITVSGMRRSRAWATNQYVFFVIKFSKPIKHYGIWEKDVLKPGETKRVTGSKNLKAFFQFTSASKEILVKVALSFVSVEGAKKNMIAESKPWDFKAIKRRAEKKWNTELGKIEVSDSRTGKLRIFYTALYHTAIVPNIYMDVDRRYRGRDNAVHTAENFTNYSVFSLWDTYRGAHPLYTILDRKRTLDYIQTFLTQYRQGGRLPVWELANCETDCMIGYHSVPVIVDAYIKGIKGFDTRLALEAMKKSATWNHLGLPALISQGVIEMDDESESVSKTLEYAYDDWCIATFAKAIGKQDDYLEFIRRAQYYKNILDPGTGFMRPRKNGGWLSPFDPREVNNNFTEANSWQYSFYMPQDLSGYLDIIGGRKKLEEKLDKLFSENPQTTGREQSDITGLIGQYAHGNEPSHHIAYLYNFAGVPHKTQAMVHRIMNEMYHDSPEGLEGNEDCGQMSAWYVLSALGFYPVTPGTIDYIIGSPQFSSVKINLENGKTFTIQAKGVSDQNYYIKDISFNGKPYPKSWISYQDIIRGGLLEFTMDSKPSYGLAYPQTAIAGEPIVLNPVISGGSISFRDSKKISIGSSQKDINIYYTMDGSVPTTSSHRFVQPIIIRDPVSIKAIAVDAKGRKSMVTTAKYFRIDHNWSVLQNSPYERQYDGGGGEALIDAIRGTTDWRKGNWQGYQGNDMDIIIDLAETRKLSSVEAGFLQDTRAWIIMPKHLQVELSTDNKNFTKVYEGSNFLPVENLAVQLKDVTASFTPFTARYVRIIARQFGALPSWHEGAGGSSHIFIDEIKIK